MQLIKTIFLFGFCLCVCAQAFCQENISEYTLNAKYSNIVLALNRLETKKSNIAQNAEVIYEGLGYAKAANMFKSSSDEENADRVLWTKLANSARLNANYEEATYWYSKVTNDGPLPIDLLHYAQALQAVGKCEEAVKWFKLYNNSPTNNKVAFIENCSDVENFTSFDEVFISTPEALNTGKLDFSARPFNDGVVFTSNRGGSFFSRLIDSWTNKGFTDLYFSKKNESGYAKPKHFKKAINGKFHDGVAAFTNDNATMYFTRNDKNKNAKSEVVNLKIYQAHNAKDLAWTAPVELPFNDDTYSTCHPTITEDGSTMYFASDRPGGFGGMDIYKVTQTNGDWTQPKNCGPSINSAGNEVFPFITSEGDLAFSSNGQPGMGGLDVYVAREKITGSNNWDRIVNAGTPFNSIKDDFGFYMNKDNTSGFVSSSRVGGENNDDILEWNTNTPVDFFPVLSREQIFCVVDKKTGYSMVNTEVKIVQSNQNDSFDKQVTTDVDGRFSLTVWPDTKVELDLNKAGYDKSEENVDFKNYNSIEEECIKIEMKKEDAVAITGTVLNGSENDTPISNASVVLVNSCTNNETKLKSDKNGKFSFYLPCGCDYTFKASKAKLNDASKNLKANKINCNSNEEVVLKLTKPAPVVKTLNFEEKKFLAGMILPINNINYDYNKSNIRPDAAKELDIVVDLLVRNPSLMVELGSHTDARGSASYNLKLSSARAAAAQSYVISKGISMDRISSRGYGESQLLNECDEKSNCSDEQHEENRRTQVKVLNF
jgi:outer membrane protein OmpA-like peptidoglycan-associated protein/tetratricopeptide (TPR) repeat protein